MNIFKKLLLTWFGFISMLSITTFASPNYDNFQRSLRSDTYSLSVDKSSSLEDNVRRLVLSSTSNGPIFSTILNIWVWLLVIYLVRWGILFLMNADNEAEIKKYKMNLLYILYGAFLFFGGSWIVNSALEFETSQGIVSSSWWILTSFQNNLMLQILAFLKMAAYFVAICMVAYYWYKIMKAFEQEDKIKEARKWVINILLSLVFIKIIDYLFFIAQQTDFGSRAKDLIVSASKTMWYVLWLIFILSILYAWFLMITSRWEEDSWKKAKNIIKAVFIVSLIVFLFFLIVYQLVSDFWW